MSGLLRLGVIGMSPGNGHPYSWSAICNGYDPAAMADCGFPVIAQYLAEQDWPAARLPDVEVTHVWTQDAELSRRIARAARIGTVAERPEDMTGAVDGLLLARDDADRHLDLAAPFLQAGLPVYVDKPVALSRSALDALYECARREAQIFSCSALRYSEELRLSDVERDETGPLQLVEAVTPKGWATYAMHIVEPVLRLPECVGPVRILSRAALPGGGALVVAATGGPVISLTAAGQDAASPIEIRYTGSAGRIVKRFSDSFTAFRSALAAFVDGARTGKTHAPRRELERLVAVIEAGSLQGHADDQR